MFMGSDGDMDGLSDQFEFLCKDILSAQGLQIAYLVESSEHQGDMLVFRNIDNVMRRVIVETKFYRSNYVSSSLLKKAIVKLLHGMEGAKADSALLIISVPLESSVRSLLQRDYGVHIWDRSILVHISKHRIELFKRFRKILNEGLVFNTDNGFQEIGPILKFSSNSIFQTVSTTPIAHGTQKTDLHGDLERSKSGKGEWDFFETKCTEALQLLFEEDLSGWFRTPVMDDGISRNRIICRVSSNHDMWRGIQKDYRSKYILFEFFNHDSRVPPGVVETISRGLGINSMRTVGFVFSRMGFDPEAQETATRLLIENGFLLVDISIFDVLRMLDLWENGDDPCNPLIDKIDRFMMRL